jgi:hypothetical protein
LIDDSGQTLEGEDVHANWPQTEVHELLPWLLYENRVLASGVLFRRQGLHFNPACRYSGDWVALLECSAAGPAVCVADRLTFWRQHENNTYLASPRQMSEEIRVRETIDRLAPTWLSGRWDTNSVRRGLGQNALNLLALRAFFLDASGARAAGLEAIRYGNRPALKRTLGTILGIERLRKHLWPRVEGQFADVSHSQLEENLRDAPAIQLALPEAAH